MVHRIQGPTAAFAEAACHLEVQTYGRSHLHNFCTSMDLRRAVHGAQIHLEALHDLMERALCLPRSDEEHSACCPRSSSLWSSRPSHHWDCYCSGFGHRCRALTKTSSVRVDETCHCCPCFFLGLCPGQTLIGFSCILRRVRSHCCLVLCRWTLIFFYHSQIAS